MRRSALYMRLGAVMIFWTLPGPCVTIRVRTGQTHVGAPAIHMIGQGAVASSEFFIWGSMTEHPYIQPVQADLFAAVCRVRGTWFCGRAGNVEGAAVGE
jgi:hypothetical protein